MIILPPWMASQSLALKVSTASQAKMLGGSKFQARMVLGKKVSRYISVLHLMLEKEREREDKRKERRGRGRRICVLPVSQIDI